MNTISEVAQQFITHRVHGLDEHPCDRM